MTKILVVDDHAVVRQGLKQILAESPDLVVAGEASTGQEALDKVRTGQWDVVVLDITLPDRSGLTVLEQLKIHHPELPVLVLSMHAEEQYALRVMKAGAAGYLPKESAPEQLVSAIHKVAHGGKYVSPTLMERFVSELGADPHKPRHEMLSDRECRGRPARIAPRFPSPPPAEGPRRSRHVARDLQVLPFPSRSTFPQSCTICTMRAVDAPNS